MKPLLSKWFGRREIGRNKALRIVAEKTAADIGELKCYDGLPDNCHPYSNVPSSGEPFWCVYVPWQDGVLALRSSPIILVSKRTGKILCDGSANDEG